MANIKFFIRSQKKDREAPIFIRVYYGRTFDVIAQTKQHTKPAHWDKSKQIVKNLVDATYKDVVNDQLSEIRSAVRKELPKVGDNVNKQWLEGVIDKYYNPDKYEEKPMTLFRYIQQFIDHAPKRISKTGDVVCYKQIREYCSTFDHLKQYAESENTEFDFNDIDNSVTSDFFSGFVNYLKGKNLAQNTIHKKIQTLKIFLNNATYDGYNTKMKYKTFTIDKELTEAVYLNEKELKLISTLDLNNEKLDRVRDLFLIGCWTGLRFSDWNQVTKDNIKVDGKGNLRLHIKQKKTGNTVKLPLHKVVLDLLEKYNNKLPELISNQKFNDYLKEIAQKAKLTSDEFKRITRGGIERTTKYKKWEIISTHTARRSFATNLFDRGVKPYVIMQMTGHKQEAAFYRYIRKSPEDYADEVLKIWGEDEKPVMKVAN